MMHIDLVLIPTAPSRHIIIRLVCERTKSVELGSRDVDEVGPLHG